MGIFEEVARTLGAELIGHQPLAGGVSARVTSLELAMPGDGTRRVVVREPGAAEWKNSGQSARREFELLRHLRGAGLPVPRPLLVEDQRPQAFFVMEFIEGTTNLPSDAPQQLADVLGRIHTVPFENAPSLPELEDPLASLPEFLGPERSALRARVSELALTPRRTLLHGDFWPGNVLWQDREVVAVLDWEDATVGDPLSDVACSRLELRYVLGAAGAQAFTRRYAQQTQRPLAELPIWDAYVAAAALASMGKWGLPAAREAHMRQVAEAALAEATRALL